MANQYASGAANGVANGVSEGSRDALETTDRGESSGREGYGGEVAARGGGRSDTWDWRYGPETGVDVSPPTRGVSGAEPLRGPALPRSEGRGRRRWRRASQGVGDVMTRNPKAVKASDPVQQIAQIMVDEDTGIVPVVDEQKKLLGVVTDRDVVCRLIARGLDSKAATARDVMTEEVECVTERDTLDDVLRLMSENQVRRVPVVAEGDRLVGIVSMADLAREADVDEKLQDAFEDISSERRFWTRLR